jgi:mono/diheme cytochrome c family protein
MRAGVLVVCLCLIALGAAALAAEPPKPVSADVLRAGGETFEKWCAPCHAAGTGNAGTMALAARLGKEKSVLLERTDIADAYVKTVVRYGFRMMPPFKTTEISDADLDVLAAYVASGGGKRPVAATGPSP